MSKVMYSTPSKVSTDLPGGWKEIEKQHHIIGEQSI